MALDLESGAGRVGPKVNNNNSKVLRRVIELYPSSLVGTASKVSINLYIWDVAQRISVWKCNYLNTNIKLGLFRASFLSMLLYRSSIWKVRLTATQRFQASVNTYLRRITRVNWSDSIKNAMSLEYGWMQNRKEGVQACLGSWGK